MVVVPMVTGEAFVVDMAEEMIDNEKIWLLIPYHESHIAIIRK